MPLFNPSTASGNFTVQKAGTTVASRPTINFIEGSNISETVADNPGATSVDVTIAASVGAASAAGAYAVGTLNTFGEGSCLGDTLANIASQFIAAAAWPTANKAFYIPVQLLVAVTVYKIAWYNGATVGTNSVDVGIYTEAGTKIISTGSTLTAGASQPQVVDIADTALAPDTYFLAMAMNGTTDTVFRNAANGNHHRASGVQQQLTAFALPATATFAAYSDAYVPVIAAVFESSVF